MKNIALAALTLSSLVTTTWSAAAVAAVTTPAPAAAAAPVGTAAPILRPGAGRVALNIHTTQPRRGLVRGVAIPGFEGLDRQALQQVCTTPCRLYVAPGVVHVTLVGNGSHEYEWEVPASGGSVSLLSRRPDGSLDPLPPELPAAHDAVTPNRAIATTGAAQHTP